VGARQVPYLDRVPDLNVERRLGGLLNAHTGLRRAPDAAGRGGINRRRHSRATHSTLGVIIIVVDPVRVGPTSLGLLRHRRPHHHLLLLGRYRSGGSIIISGAAESGSASGIGGTAERAERIVDGLEASRLSDESTGPTGGAR
jgi:hypothetical protein